MVAFNIVLLASSVFATFTTAAPTTLFERELKSFPASVTCPVTTLSTTAKTFTKAQLRAAVNAFPGSKTEIEKIGKYPKEYRLADRNGHWPFAGTTACDNFLTATGDIFEVPIGAGAEIWGSTGFAKKPGNYRILFAIDANADHIYCGMTAHASKQDLNDIVACTSST